MKASLVTYIFLIAASGAQAGDGFTRMFCYGIDVPGKLDSRNDIAVVAQQTDNTALGAEGFVSSHPDYEKDRVVKGFLEGTRFSVYIFKNASKIASQSDEENPVPVLLAMKEEAFFGFENAYGIRSGEEFRVDWDDRDFGTGSINYDHRKAGNSHAIGSKFEGGFYIPLHCEAPYRVEVPGLIAE